MIEKRLSEEIKRKTDEGKLSMPLDYIILLAVGVAGIGGGLFLLREAKKYHASRR